MKNVRRKVTLNLMPMLDLMLIVIFAQYLAMRDQSQHEEARASQAVSSAEEQRQLLEVERIAVAEQRREAEMIADRAFDQRDLVGKLASELFNLPDETVAKLLKQRFPEDPPSDDEITAMQQEFRRLRGRRGQEVVKHLMTFNELRKRCDVWELYVSETGRTTLKAGDVESTFRAENPKEFATHLFGEYRVLAQPKGLVLIVLSYGEIREYMLDAAVKGLPLAIDRMQADAAGRTRFEYAVLGMDQKPSK